MLHHGADGAPHHARGRTEVEGALGGVGVLLLPEDRHEEQLVADEAAPVKQVCKFFFGYKVLYTQSSSKMALQAYLGEGIELAKWQCKSSKREVSKLARSK